MSIANHQLGAGEIESEEGGQALFGGYASDVKVYRSRQLEGRIAAGAEQVGSDGGDLVSRSNQPVMQSQERAGHAIDLRRPRIGNEGDLHESASTSAGASASNSAGRVIRPVSGSSAHRSIQSISSSRPSKCSTSAVQLSTQ